MKRLKQEDRAVPEMERPSGCRHYWVIATPAGPLSAGTCKLCGEKREFPNSLGSPYYEDRATQDQASSGVQTRNSSESAGEDSD